MAKKTEKITEFVPETLVFSKDAPTTVSELLSFVGALSDAINRRAFSLREADELSRALRAALSDSNTLQVSPELANGCYRYLSIASPLPVSGYSSLICLVGKPGLRLQLLKNSLELQTRSYVEKLRSNEVGPDEKIPDYIAHSCATARALLRSATARFKIDTDELVDSLAQNITGEALFDRITQAVREAPDTPISYIKCYVYAHLYLYRLSYLD